MACCNPDFTSKAKGPQNGSASKQLAANLHIQEDQANSEARLRPLALTVIKMCFDRHWAGNAAEFWFMLHGACGPCIHEHGVGYNGMRFCQRLALTAVSKVKPARPVRTIVTGKRSPPNKGCDKSLPVSGDMHMLKRVRACTAITGFQNQCKGQSLVTGSVLREGEGLSLSTKSVTNICKPLTIRLTGVREVFSNLRMQQQATCRLSWRWSNWLGPAWSVLEMICRRILRGAWGSPAGLAEEAAWSRASSAST